MEEQKRIEEQKKAEEAEKERQRVEAEEEQRRIEEQKPRLKPMGEFVAKAGVPVEIPGFWVDVLGEERRFLKTGRPDRRDAKVCFIDRRDSVEVCTQDDETLLAALRLASEKWGTIKISGGDENYRRRCVVLAVASGIEIGNPELQDLAKQERTRREAEKAEKERQRVEAEKAEKAEKERQRVEAEEAEKEKFDLIPEAREKVIEVEAAKIAAKQQQLREQFDAAQEKWSLMLKSEPGYGVFVESKKHQIWAAEFKQQENDRLHAWEALGGDMAAPDKGEAEVRHRLTPEYAHNEAEKMYEDMERRKHARQEANEALKQRKEQQRIEAEKAEIEAIEAKDRRNAREKGYILPLEADPDKFVTLSISFNKGISDLIGKITSVSDQEVKIKLKNNDTFAVNRDRIVNISPAPDRTLPDERQAQQQNRRRSSNDLGR